jgi:hypothetical protein
MEIYSKNAIVLPNVNTTGKLALVDGSLYDVLETSYVRLDAKVGAMCSAKLQPSKFTDEYSSGKNKIKNRQGRVKSRMYVFCGVLRFMEGVERREDNNQEMDEMVWCLLQNSQLSSNATECHWLTAKSRAWASVKRNNER